ncbi:hypothetical protein JHK84_055647 [Glycine max]|nr:hypothetical protein JHK84_055647 [Glycine max]
MPPIKHWVDQNHKTQFIDSQNHCGFHIFNWLFYSVYHTRHFLYHGGDPIGIWGHADPSRWFLARFKATTSLLSFMDLAYGIQQLDHVVDNVPKLAFTVRYLKGLCGFHEFVEFLISSIHDAVNSSLFFEPKLSLSRFLLFLLRFLKWFDHYPDPFPLVD